MGDSTAVEPEALLDLALADPAAAERRARRVLDDPGTDGTDRIVARWALGLARREVGDLDDASSLLHQAADAADATGLPGLGARVRTSLALVLLHQGQTDPALAMTETAGALLDGRDAARNEGQRGLILQRLGRHEEALRAYGAALPMLRNAGDAMAELRFLNARGILHTYLGDLDRAGQDLRSALVLAQAADQPFAQAMALHNLGFLAGRAGRTPQGLRYLDQATVQFRRAGVGPAKLAPVAADRAEMLADAGLVDEAVEQAVAALRAVHPTGDRTGLAEARLLLARMLLLAQRFDDATLEADRAAELFASDDRPGWLLQARYVAVVAASASGIRWDAEEAEWLAVTLARAGWLVESWSARIVMAQQAVHAGDVAAARRMLPRADDAGSDQLPALVRAQERHATALVEAATGNRARALRAIEDGLDLLLLHRAVFSSAEMRAHATTHTVGLAELGVRLVLEDGNVERAVDLLDRARSMATLGGGPGDTRRGEDPELVDALARLRALQDRAREAAGAGTPDATLQAARAAAERRVRDLARQGHTEGADFEVGSGSRLDLAVLRERLVGGTLVAYATLEGRLQALTVEPSGTRHLRLGEVDEVRAEAAHLRAAVRRLARARIAPVASAAAQSLARSAERLVELLGIRQVRSRDLVIVPNRALEGIAWSALGTVAGGVPIRVVPSAQAWLRAQSLPAVHGPTVLVAGPGLAGADVEVRRLAARCDDAVVLRGRQATVRAVREAMVGAGLVHVATHGEFRSDNPLFSSLQLVDGDLTVYDLRGLTDAPGRVVLSSCSVGAHRALAGDAMLGLGAVLLQLGVRSVVAPVVEVADAAAVDLMVRLHTHLATAAPAEALAAAVAAPGDADPKAAAARAAFVAMGA